jgi:hypothetical protein
MNEKRAGVFRRQAEAAPARHPIGKNNGLNRHTMSLVQECDFLKNDNFFLASPCIS